MSNLPDFTNNGYQLTKEISRNREGGRVTYSATQNGKEVVIKRFCFAQIDSSWTGFKAHQREIQVLERINHPSIPRYLNSFETPDGFCLVQEYKNAPSLAEKLESNPELFNPQFVKKIAISVLEILVYLQKNRIYHRDIKPENILLDEKFNVYLIDFGFSRIGEGAFAQSSIVSGTMGFMPFEQLHQKVNKSSDLYSLGVTLICLLTKTLSSQIGKLISHDGIKFKNKVPSLSTDFIKWLEKMIAQKSEARFSDAQEALNKLKSISVEGLSFSEQLNKLFEKRKKSLIMISIGIILIGTGLFIVKQKQAEAEKKLKNKLKNKLKSAENKIKTS